MNKFQGIVALAALAAATSSVAQVKVGVILPLSGPAAILGIGAKNAMSLMPDRIGATKVEFILLDDASDTTAAVVSAKKLITEHKVDIVVGPSTTPQCLAVIDPVAESETPMIALGSSSRIIEPVDEKRRWIFKTVPNDAVWLNGMTQHMTSNGVKTAAFLGFDDAFGEGFLKEFEKFAALRKIQFLGAERFNRRDTSVTAQALKLISMKPDAVLIVASGAPAALPHATLTERGYKGKIYQTAGAVSKEFLQIGGKGVEGGFLSVGPCLVAEQLPADHPLKSLCIGFVNRYEAKFGKDSRNLFATQGYDFWRMLERAIPVAVQSGAQPGTKEFRRALRDAMEGIKNLQANTGFYNFSPTDHSGLDHRAQVMVTVRNGGWRFVE